MSDTFKEFDKRLGRIGHKKRQLSRGYIAELGSDGLITIKPKRRERGFPFFGLGLLIVGFLMFKAIMLAHLGLISYEERVGKLQAGTQLEQAGAWVMQADRATVLIADTVRPVFGKVLVAISE